MQLKKVDSTIICHGSRCLAETGQCTLGKGENLCLQLSWDISCCPWNIVLLPNMEPSQCTDSLLTCDLEIQTRSRVGRSEGRLTNFGIFAA
jgi:hypothetical protein